MERRGRKGWGKDWRTVAWDIAASLRNDLKRDPSAQEVRREWEKRAAEGRLKPDIPPLRTIGRWVGKEWEDASSEEREAYQRFRWPESMEQGLLPWEASAAGLELLGAIDRDSPGDRPPIRVVRWYWQLSMAAPSAPFNERFRLAMVLAADEAIGRHDQALRRGVEGLLSYTPWRKDGPFAQTYQQAKQRRVSPVPPFQVTLAMPLRGSEESIETTWWALGALFGLRPRTEKENEDG